MKINELTENFTKIPNELFEKNQLNPLEFQTYCTLLRHCQNKNICFPSQEKLSQEINRSSRRIRDTLIQLESYGLILKIPHYRGRTNGYMVSKNLCVDRKLAFPILRSKLPLKYRSHFPTNNKREEKKEERFSRVGMEHLKNKMKELYPEKFQERR